jgi:hypothetical protein
LGFVVLARPSPSVWGCGDKYLIQRQKAPVGRIDR